MEKILTALIMKAKIVHIRCDAEYYHHFKGDKMTTYLVTGGAGFIGSNFVLYMLERYKDITIINLDKLTYAGNLENLRKVEKDPRYVFVKGDICDEKLTASLLEEWDPDLIVNFAGESHVDRSIKDPDAFLNTNVKGVVNLLQRAKDA